MLRVIFSLLLVTAAFSFTVRNAAFATSKTALLVKSKALPFLEAPQKLDGTIVGDFGFDPLGFTENFNDIKYLQSAELKHGRVAMLATVGFVFQQYVHFASSEADPIKAIFALGTGPNLQVLSFIGVIELATWSKTFFGETPGDLGFDPMGQMKGKTKKQMDDLKLKEIKNGRLAMIAFMGMLTQNLVFNGQPTLVF